jgi:hypothetical protein
MGRTVEHDHRTLANDPNQGGARILFVVLFFFVALVGLSYLDEPAMERIEAETAAARERAIRIAVEDSNMRVYFRSDMHCRVPVKGERLDMQLADTKDPGQGYRCTYYSKIKGWGGVVRHVEFSRSPAVKLVFAEPTRVLR